VQLDQHAVSINGALSPPGMCLLSLVAALVGRHSLSASSHSSERLAIDATSCCRVSLLSVLSGLTLASIKFMFAGDEVGNVPFTESTESTEGG
jgi:hypothetical protein